MSVRITSTANATVREIRKLTSRKGRRRQGRFWAEGIGVALTAFECGWPLERVVTAPELLAPGHLRAAREAAARADVPELEVSAEVFGSLSGRDGPSGLGVVGEIRHPPLHEVDPRRGSCWLALDGVQYPGNLGTIVRTADAVGAGGVVLLGEGTDPFDPSAIRASKGTVFGLPLVRADDAGFLRWARRGGATLVGLAPHADVDLRDAELPRPRVLLLGSEQHGLRAQLERACDLRVGLPMAGRADSLNIAVAAGVALFEVQRRER